MEWIDRYIHAVADYLPDKNREDITQELRSSLYEQMEDQREELGHEPEDEDQQAFLQRLGHPMKVAAGYAQQQYLIGPSLFPQYRYTMKIGLSIVIAIQIALTIVTMFISADIADKIPGFLSRLMYAVVLTAGIITLTFALLEYYGEKLDWYETWKPSSLPPLTPDLRVDRAENIFDVVIETIALLWWNGVIGFHNTITNDGGSVLPALSDEWAVFYWPINLTLLGALALHCHHLFSDQWTVLKIRLEIALDLASLTVLYFLLQIETRIVAADDAAVSGSMAGVISGLDGAIWYVLLAIVVIGLYELYKHGRISYRLTRSHSTAE